MTEQLADHAARERFRSEWDRNFAVCANAGSGKTTAISERLAALALAPDGAERLRRTAVVTYTRKAARQIALRARQVLLRRLTEAKQNDLSPLDHLERAFFNTIHGFCLMLAQRHGRDLGIHLHPTVVEGDDSVHWEEFLEEDSMQFAWLGPTQVDAYLRHASLEGIFDLAREMNQAMTEQFHRVTVPEHPPEPDAAALEAIRAARTRGRAVEKLARNQEQAEAWVHAFRKGSGHLPFPTPEGTAAGIIDLYEQLFAPVKEWLAQAGAVMAAELARRYRDWRFERGVQTFADQIDAAMSLLSEPAILERIRMEDWNILLDEAQDTDPHQFEVLVEVTRPPGAPAGTWPNGDGAEPRPGRFCMVGDGQQAIYGSRADIRHFQRQLEAFRRSESGECLVFSVTFRSPRRVAAFLNASLAGAFGVERPFNLGLPPEAGAPPPLLQVSYEPLEPAPHADEGVAARLMLRPAEVDGRGVQARLALEVRRLAELLKQGGPAAVGARNWGEVALLAPRNEWLATARGELEAMGLKTALQMRRNRNGDNPAYAWLCGLLAALCNPNDTYEWVGVLREVFAVPDDAIARALHGREGFAWDEPSLHEEPVRSALDTLQPLVSRVEMEGEPLERFATELVRLTELEAKAWEVDPGGAVGDELERLVAQAADLGLTGAGPRDWLRELLAGVDRDRPLGKPESDAINLLTSHSAKGLEWPVVIPIGLWRGLRRRTPSGLRLIAGAGEGLRVFFDNHCLPESLAESREREWLREQVRLLYVTLTRGRRALLVPWAADFETPQANSFLELWGVDAATWPKFVPGETPEEVPVAPRGRPRVDGVTPIPSVGPAPALPTRILPHQLAQKPDFSRGARHESTEEEPGPGSSADEAVAYGVWWHETMEFLPWKESETAIDRHLGEAFMQADADGFGDRAREEWQRLQQSEAWAVLRDRRWIGMAEVGILAPLGEQGWIDGVIDLVLQDAESGRLEIVDWKTNHRRAGEGDEALAVRLVEEYRPQLEAYGRGTAAIFPEMSISLRLYSTVLGRFLDLSGPVRPR